VVDGSYQVGPNLVGIRCTSKKFGDALDRALSAHWATETAHAIFSVVVSGGREDGGRPGKQFHVLYKYASPLLKTLHLPTLVRGLFAELESLTFGQRDDAMFLHAGLVASNGALAIGPGSMASYLTRVGRRVERAGLSLAPSRFTAIDLASGQVIPVPTQLEVPRNALSRLEAVIPADRPDNRHGLILDGPRRLDAVFDFYGDQPLMPMSKALAVSRLARGVVNFPKLGVRALEGLIRLVQGTPCLGLGRPQPREMLDILASGLKRP
jgi:hypothetical protein